MIDIHETQNMEHTLRKLSDIAYGGTISIDTSLVAFFLSLEYGRAVQMLSVDGLLMGTTLLMVLTLPYFLPSRFEKGRFGDWMIGRGAVAAVGMIAGVLLSRGMGSVVPEVLRSLPMTLLILASMVSAYVQFYQLFKLRPVK